MRLQHQDGIQYELLELQRPKIGKLKKHVKYLTANYARNRGSTKRKIA